MAIWARNRIWDTAAYFSAAPAQRANIQIELQDFKITGKAVWNATAFKQWGQASSLPDLQGLQEITESACWLPFQGTLDTVLAPNAKGFYSKIDVAADLSRAEVAEGLLSTPVLGPSLFPIKLVPRNVATVWRNGKIKDRGTADCTVSGDFEEHSPNKGFLIEEDEYHYPTLTFISSSLVAFIGAIIIEAGPDDFTISKCDWSRYYRQLARCESMLWLQGAMTLSNGMTLDYRLIFGDRSAVNSANRTQNNLIWILRHLVLLELGLPDQPPETWFRTLITQTWVKPRARAWMAERFDLFGGPTSAMDAIEQSESIWNLIPCSLAAGLTALLTPTHKASRPPAPMSAPRTAPIATRHTHARMTC